MWVLVLERSGNGQELSLWIKKASELEEGSEPEPELVLAR